MIRNERLTAAMDGDFVVFLIGMRINQWHRVHKWWPVASAMPKMLSELARHPGMGLLHAESWFGRNTLVVQYWRSIDHLLAYATNQQAEHLPAWRAFNEAIGTDGSVGIWHETYKVSHGGSENVYVNMPPFGLGKVGVMHPANGDRKSAAGRLASTVPPPGNS
jgi:hypothetical protein